MLATTKIAEILVRIVLPLLLTCLAGCLPDQSTLDSVSHVAFSADTLAAYSLEGISLVDPDVLGSPNVMAVGSQYILVGDHKAVTPLLLFDRFSGALVESASGIGRGPGEISGYSNLDFKAGHDTGWILDIPNRSLIFAHLDSLAATGLPSNRRIRLAVEGFVLSTTWVEPDTILGWGVFPYDGMALIDTNGAFQRAFGEVPPGEDNVAMHVRNQAWRKTLRTSPSGDRFIAAYFNSDRLDIYEGGILRRVVRGPDFFDPVYLADGVGSRQMFALQPENRRGYVDVTVTDGLVFALYSGRTMYETAVGQEPGAYVVVFDWTGRPLGRLNCSGSPFSIAVSADNQDLYAIYLTPEPRIIRYQLPQDLIL